MATYAILAEGTFSYLFAKTGNALIRYLPDDVVGVIDSRYHGSTAQEVIGFGGDIPVVKSIDQLIQFKPDTLVLGNAPQGGRISEPYKREIVKSINHGLNVISGMHEFISDDPFYKDLAKENGIRITDLRKPPSPYNFPKKTWMDRTVPVVLTIGSDCDSGKMTTSWELVKLLNNEGIDARFIGTGQTGILLSGQGVPIDAVVSDFMAGEIEYVIDQNLDAELIIVEGQGSLVNMLYSGVTLGLVHGAMPDYYIMCHEPTRTHDVSNYPIPGMEYMLDLYTSVMKPFKSTEVVGMNLITHSMNDADAKAIIGEYNSTYHIPATDIVRFGGDPIVRRLKKELQ